MLSVLQSRNFRIITNVPERVRIILSDEQFSEEDCSYVYVDFGGCIHQDEPKYSIEIDGTTWEVRGLHLEDLIKRLQPEHEYLDAPGHYCFGVTGFNKVFITLAYSQKLKSAAQAVLKDNLEEIYAAAEMLHKALSNSGIVMKGNYKRDPRIAGEEDD